MQNISSGTSCFINVITNSTNGKNTLHTEDDWLQFLYDHREWLANQSGTTTVEIDESTMLKYRYRIEDYLVDILQLPSSLALPFRIINRFCSNLDFNLKVTSVIVPTNSDVQRLRKQYQVIQTKLKKLDS